MRWKTGRLIQIRSSQSKLFTEGKDETLDRSSRSIESEISNWLVVHMHLEVRAVVFYKDLFTSANSL
jgi:hypothetical protein